MCTSNGEEYLAEAKLHGALGFGQNPSDDKLEEILISKQSDRQQSTSTRKVPAALVSSIETVDSENQPDT